MVKMYLLPEFRGKGIGRTLLQHCLHFAKTMGFEQVYLESMPELVLALTLYETSMFEKHKH